MGKPDLIYIINGKAFLVKGTDYEDEHDAMMKAVAQYQSRVKGFIDMALEAKPEELSEDKDDMLRQLEDEKIIHQIEMYTL